MKCKMLSMVIYGLMVPHKTQGKLSIPSYTYIRTDLSIRPR